MVTKEIRDSSAVLAWGKSSATADVGSIRKHVILVDALPAAPDLEGDAVGLFDRDIRVEGGSELDGYWPPLVFDGEPSSTRRVGVKIPALNLHVLQPGIL